MRAWRGISLLFAGFAAWAAVMQLNDPDPERWFALYASAAVVASASALGRPLPRAAGVLCATSLIWAAAIVPELIGHWQVTDLGATMSRERPEVEYGRELGGLLIVATYCLAAALLGRRRSRSPGVTQSRPSEDHALSDPPNAA